MVIIMKKLTALLLALALGLSLIACGTEAPEDTGSADTTDSPASGDTGAAGELTADANGYFCVDGIYIEPVDPADEAMVKRFADKFIALQNQHFKNNKVYLATVPDKTDYIKDQTSQALDHEVIREALQASIPQEWQYIELGGILSLNDYYATDNHWRQEKILPIVDTLAQAMGFTVTKEAFEEIKMDDFIGAYGYTAKDLSPEPFSYLMSKYIDSAKSNHFQRKDFTGIYDPALLAKPSTAYDFFLGGASPVITITANPDAEKSLVIFCDSFSSSLTPLLLEGYSKITLIDLRYMMSNLIPQYARIGDADVLILYSDRIVNNSLLLK